MDQAVLAIYYLFWIKMHSQKRPWLDTKNKPFPPPLQTTPSVNLLTMGPPPLHWLDTGWWYSNHSVVVLLLPASFSFFSTLFLPLIFGFALFCSWILFTHVHFYGERYGFIRLAPLLPLLGPVGLLAAIFCQTGLFGLLSFLSFFWTFTAFVSVITF